VGVALESSNQAQIQGKPLGQVEFVYAVAPHHPLASAPEPLSDALIAQHRAVAVADSIQRGAGMTFGLLGGQDVFTVGSMSAKLDAQLRGLGGGHLPACMANRFIEAGHLVVKKTEHPQRVVAVSYAWRASKTSKPGRALQWWLNQLESATTRAALLQQHRSI
jgi:DNA-binding transcriptional LysR family regulator